MKANKTALERWMELEPLVLKRAKRSVQQVEVRHPYDRTPQQIEEAKKLASRIIGERDQE